MSNDYPLRIWMLLVDHLTEIRRHGAQENINQGSSLPVTQASPPACPSGDKQDPGCPLLRLKSRSESLSSPPHATVPKHSSHQWQADLTPRRHRFRREGPSKPDLGNPVARFSQCKCRLSSKTGVSVRRGVSPGHCMGLVLTNIPASYLSLTGDPILYLAALYRKDHSNRTGLHDK